MEISESPVWLPIYLTAPSGKRGRRRTVALGGDHNAYFLGDDPKNYQILLDRTSLEVFANDGEVSMTSCLVPAEQNTPLELYAKRTEVYVESLTVEKLRSAWRE